MNTHNNRASLEERITKYNNTYAIETNQTKRYFSIISIDRYWR